MTFTYSGNPGSSNRDQVRFLIGDTDPAAEEKLSDEEIQYLISRHTTNIYRAAAEAADQLSVRYLKLSATSKKVGDLNLGYDYGSTSARYADLARKLWTGDTRATVGAAWMKDTSENLFTTRQTDNDGQLGKVQHWHP